MDRKTEPAWFSDSTVICIVLLSAEPQSFISASKCVSLHVSSCHSLTPTPVLLSIIIFNSLQLTRYLLFTKN